MDNDINDCINNLTNSLLLNESSIDNKESDTDEIDDNIEFKARSKPGSLVKEKIIICLDTCIDPDSNPFNLKNGNTLYSLELLKKHLHIFMCNRSYINDIHEYAVITLDKIGINWIQGFTTNYLDVIQTINNVNYTSEPSSEYDLSSLLEAVQQAVPIPKQKNNTPGSSSYVVRVILFYNRSHCVPVLSKSFSELLGNPNFLIDVVVTHEENVPKTLLEKIYMGLQVDQKENPYFFAVGRNPTTLYHAFGRLLGHPFQRPIMLLKKSEIVDVKIE